MCVGVQSGARMNTVSRPQIAKASLFYFVFVMYSYTTAGPFGLEDQVTTSGPGMTLIYHLVIDEAHHLEEAATSGLRQEVDGQGLLALLDRLARDESGRRLGLIEEIRLQPGLGAASGVETALAEAAPAALNARRCSWILIQLRSPECLSSDPA